VKAMVNPEKGVNDRVNHTEINYIY